MTKQNKQTVDYISFVYGALVFLGGLIGYVKAGSLVSLGAGVLFGSAAILGAYLSSQNSKNFHLALITAAALLVLMGFRFYNSGKFMPAGLLSGLSLFQSVRLAVRYTEKGKQQID